MQDLSPCPRRWPPLLAVGLLLIAALGVPGCGLLSSTGPGDDVPRTQVEIRGEPDLAAAVTIDSISWLPALPDPDFPGFGDELEGTFAARFVNGGQQPVAIRYDLRFYDADTFLIDDYIPHGQPVELPPRSSRRVRGPFLLRGVAPAEIGLLATMRITATVAAPE